MKRLFATLLLSVWVGSSLGCAMCNRCGDEDYGFWGGTHPRARLASGRVGSAFDDAEGVAHYSDEMAGEEYVEEEMLEGEIIDDGAAMPAEEILPVPMTEELQESTPLEPVPEAAPDSPPGSQPTRTTAPRSTSGRKSVKPENYLP